jgi:hypothetical protein
MEYRLVVVIATVLSVTSTGVAGPVDVLPTGGINLAGYNYYERAVPFVDFAKMSHEWISTNGSVWSDGRPIETTPTGYPARLEADQIARTLVFTHNGGRYETGVYELTWEGSGSVRLSSGSGALSVTHTDVNTIHYDVQSAHDIGLLLEILNTEPSDPVRNISLIPSRYKTQSSLFHPLYKRDLQNYGVLRFLDWIPTNGNWIADWEFRTKLDQAHWGNLRGIPYELQIELGNELGQDIWLTIPHAASDDYITQLARLVEQQLDPDLRVWIEYSNETWNPSFAQNSYVRQVLTERYGTSIMVEAYAMRAGEVFDLVAQEIPSERLIRVVGGWAQTPFVLNRALPTLSGDQGTVNGDVAAIATYFRLSSEQMDALYTDYSNGTVDTDQVFADLRTAIDEASFAWEDNQQIAAAHGLPLVSYEGGQHLVAATAQQRNDEGFTQFLLGLQRDPRMGDLYSYLAEKWREIGGATLTLFNNADVWSRTGAWGLKEGFDDPVAPKFDAVQEYLRANPGGWDLRTGRWLGDLDGSGQLDVADIDLLTARVAQGDGDSTFDLNRDGAVDRGDHQFWITSLKLTLPGDANLDGRVDTSDLVLALQQGGYEDDLLTNSTWAGGDWNGDQEFTSADLVAMLQAGGFNEEFAAVAAVPEAGAGWLLVSGLLGLAGLVARRRQLTP